MATVPTPRNEPVRSYAPGTPERAEVKEALAVAAAEVVEVPIHAGAPRHTVPDLEVTMPHDHGHLLARGHRAGPEDVQAAIDAALEARADWARTSLEERAAVFLRAAELLAGPWRQRINAACMLGQSKTIHQSEIDAVCELADFWRCNVAFLEQIEAMQPYSPPGQLEPRRAPPAGRLRLLGHAVQLHSPSPQPAHRADPLLGNTSVWKPASTSTLLELPPDARSSPRPASLPACINDRAGFGPAPSGIASSLDRRLAGRPLHGLDQPPSTHIWRKGVAERLDRYGQFPRIVGETGGKDFVVAHASADVDALATAHRPRRPSSTRGRSAPRRAAPTSRTPAAGRRSASASWRDLDHRDPLRRRARFRQLHGGGDRPRVLRPSSRTTASSAVGPRAPRERGRLRGECDASHGYFVQPTVIKVQDPKDELMRTEWFGPLLSVYVYEESRFEDVLQLCDETSEYALTGAVFGQDRFAIRKGLDALRYAAGNFYVNDKPTGAVVGQQPFGGSRASGTNDKAGSLLNLLRWISPRSVKETFVPRRTTATRSSPRTDREAHWFTAQSTSVVRTAPRSTTRCW
jgi:1-pyrroline-5-carboxylate dehydrogenase